MQNDRNCKILNTGLQTAVFVVRQFQIGKRIFKISCFIGRQVLQYRFAGMHGKITGYQIDDAELFKGIGQAVKQDTLFAYGFCDIAAGETVFVQPLIDLINDHIFHVQVAGSIGDRIIEGKGIIAAEMRSDIFR